MNEPLDITSAQYVKIYNDVVGIKSTIEGQELFVPLDPANRHYSAILKAVEAGTLTITEADS